MLGEDRGVPRSPAGASSSYPRRLQGIKPGLRGRRGHGVAYVHTRLCRPLFPPDDNGDGRRPSPLLARAGGSRGWGAPPASGSPPGGGDFRRAPEPDHRAPFARPAWGCSPARGREGSDVGWEGTEPVPWALRPEIDALFSSCGPPRRPARARPANPFPEWGCAYLHVRLRRPRGVCLAAPSCGLPTKYRLLESQAGHLGGGAAARVGGIERGPHVNA